MTTENEEPDIVDASMAMLRVIMTVVEGCKTDEELDIVRRALLTAEEQVRHRIGSQGDER